MASDRRPPHTPINPWLFREALASVSLSHEEKCRCLTCRAALGDEAAMREMFAALTGLNPNRATDAVTRSTITVVVEADTLDGGYVATMPELPGCAGEGETIGDALRNIADAYEGVTDG